MVHSMEALNASIRQLSQDLRRTYDAQSRFTPGEEGEAARRAGGNMSQQGQTRHQDFQGASRGRYDHGAGRTTQQSIGRAAQNFAQQVFQGQQGQHQGGGGGGGQNQGQQAPQPPQQQHAPYMPPPYMYQPYGPQGPYQGQPMPPMGPQGPYGGGGGGGWGGGSPYWYGGGGGQHQGGQGGWTNSALNQARKVPYVGTAMAAVSGVQNLYLSEREKNRLYQGMEGGSNLSGFAERGHEEAYRWSMGMGMSGDMARRSFKGVTSLGYNGKVGNKGAGGQGRQDALDFVYHNYNARGMDPEESLGMLQTASKDATVNFTELSEALKQVSDTAGKAGVNAKFMRQSFQGMLDASIGSGAGPGAADIAGILTSTQASYGKEFQGSDMRGQLGRSYQYMVGAQYGVGAGQLQGIIRNQPGQYARMVSGSQRSAINMVFGPDQLKHLQDLIKKYGTSQQAVPSIEQEFLNAHPEIDLNVVADTLSGALTGVELDNSNVMDWVIQQLAGNTAAAHAQSGGKTGGGKPVDIQSSGKGSLTQQVKPGQTAKTGKYGLVDPAADPSKTLKYGATPGEYLKHVNGGREFLGIFGQGENKAGEVYVNRMNKSKKRDPVLEAILQNVEDPNDTKVKVSTASGDRIVTFAEAMRLFPNEMAAGKVQIVTGDQAGKTTSELVGGNVDPTRDVKGELTGKEGQKTGQSLKDYEKKHGKIKGGDDGSPKQRVTVDLTTEAKQLLQLLPSKNNGSSATGYPPYNPNSQQGSRP
jgi:hypothetical protein